MPGLLRSHVLLQRAAALWTGASAAKAAVLRFIEVTDVSYAAIQASVGEAGGSRLAYSRAQPEMALSIVSRSRGYGAWKNSRLLASL